MASNTKFMIAAGASVVVVRDGKRKPIGPGAGFDFTEDEITAINKAVPGSLRKPINESTTHVNDADDDVEAKKPVQAKGKQAKAKKPVQATEKSDDGDDDGDEDGDI